MVNKLNVLKIHQPDQNAIGNFLTAIPTKKTQNWIAKQKENQY
jgi:uncharacterized protein YbgA (DUF1722 family)